MSFNLSPWTLTLSLLLMASLMGMVTGGHALHASWAQLEQLWQAEVKAVEQIRKVVLTLSELNGVLHRYVQSWEAIADTEPLGGSGDPAAAYSLIRHVAGGWPQVDEAINAGQAVFSDIKELASRADRELLPNADDVAAASEAVARLAHMYHLNLTALTHGGHLLQAQLMGDNTLNTASLHHHSLSVSDLASIGLVAVNKGYFSVGVEFLRAARSRAATPAHKNHEPWLREDFSAQRLDSLLSTAVKVHDHVLEIRGRRSLTHATAPTPYRDERGRVGHLDEDDDVVVGVQYLKLHGNKTWMLQERPLVEQRQVERLCRGEDLRTSLERSELHCGYASGGSPWLLLAPFKVEQISLDPYIILIHEIISPRERAHVKERASGHLHAPHNAMRGNNTTRNDWSLKHVWLEEEAVTSLQSLGLRLSHLARVTVGDHLSEPYMESPQPGRRGEDGHHAHLPAGALSRTVFPWVGVGVDAVEGAAVLWWNLLASHEHDFLTRHAACPVLRGHKWIVNKWVGYGAQWQTQPCVADPSRKVMVPWY
ncbi:Prolyl 4-hydroxylase subunit alpha-1-like 2 [Homarus americanus]|uniref:Prolyl 4-hydroxylase subunit alpha-1-like 2 n=1 Tax=Homarus americanus TaxID=6706 RepID=A0A8J5MQM6_HOMAM|nr:Prolyl 4-hydroxylase subunit alpha-1-like 2 [Homarus americanus]